MNCGAICLQHIHQSHGKRLSLTKARALAGTGRHGTYADDLVEAFHELGYRASVKHNLQWRELRRLVNSGRDVMVAWWSILDDGNGHASAPDGHYSVVKHVAPDRIVLFDPDPKAEITLPRKTFESLWFDYENNHAGRKDFIRAAVIATYPSR